MQFDIDYYFKSRDLVTICHIVLMTLFYYNGVLNYYVLIIKVNMLYLFK